VKNNERVIVTACDDNYAWLCLNLLKSMGKWARITHVIDLGLSTESRRMIEARCAGVIDVPQHVWTAAGIAVDYAGAMTIRPQLPQLFTQDYIMWMDADVWVQDRSAVKTYFDMAERYDGDFVLVTELDAEYPYCVGAFEVRQEQLRDLHSQLWDDAVAEELHGKAPLNSGVFAASRLSPVWKSFDELVRLQYIDNMALKVSTRLAHMAEQQSLNRVLHETQRFTALTAEFNWICHFGPLARRGFFVETPNLRRRPHIVHLTNLRSRESIYRENYLLYESRLSRIARFVRQRVAAVAR
jgi:lipopolysaccharide biosynthesis glycosyltransferase